MYVCMYVYVYVYVCMYLCMYVYVCMYMYVCMLSTRQKHVDHYSPLHNMKTVLVLSDPNLLTRVVPTMTQPQVSAKDGTWAVYAFTSVIKTSRQHLIEGKKSASGNGGGRADVVFRGGNDARLGRGC